MRKTLLIFAALALFWALSATAQAQSSLEGYNDEAGQVQNTVQGNGPGSATVSDSGGSLPFTGLDIALIAAAGGLLGAGGLAMRRLARAPESA
jgi:hypothetical protein